MGDDVGQGRGVERLRDVADAPCLVPSAYVAFLGPRAQEHDRDIPCLLVRSESLGDLPAVQPRKHDVEQDEVRLLRASKLDRLRPVGRLDRLEAGVREVDAAYEPDRLLVVDDQDAPGVADRPARRLEIQLSRELLRRQTASPPLAGSAPPRSVRAPALVVAKARTAAARTPNR